MLPLACRFTPKSLIWTTKAFCGPAQPAISSLALSLTDPTSSSAFENLLYFNNPEVPLCLCSCSEHSPLSMPPSKPLDRSVTLLSPSPFQAQLRVTSWRLLFSSLHCPGRPGRASSDSHLFPSTNSTALPLMSSTCTSSETLVAMIMFCLCLYVR